MTKRDFNLGRYRYVMYEDHTYYGLYSISILPPGLANDCVESYDRLLHQSLEKIFRERCHSSSELFKEFLRGYQHNADYSSMIKPILEQEPLLSRYFSKEEHGKLPLLWIAVLCCYWNSAELLVRSGADVNEFFGHRDPQIVYEKWTILHVLVQMEYTSLENVRLSLIYLVTDHGADLTIQDYVEKNVLHYAIKCHRVQITERFLEKGADLHMPDNRGLPPLLCALNSHKVLQFLPVFMRHGADVFVKSTSGDNVLHRLAYTPIQDTHSLVEIAREFIKMGVSLHDGESSCGYQPIHVAATIGPRELVDVYLDHGVDVHAPVPDGDFPLTIAVGFHNEAVVETLLRRGADVNLRTIDGYTALHVACECDALYSGGENAWRNIISLLVSYGADVIAEWNGKTPLALMASRVPDGQQLGESIWPVIEALALKKALQPTIELKDQAIIERYLKARDHFRKCTEEIDKMKSTRFIHTCYLFDLLAKSQYGIAKLMRNPEFETKFKQCDLSGSIYAEAIRRAFERARKLYQAMLDQEDIVYEAVNYILPPLLVDKILDFVLNSPRI